MVEMNTKIFGETVKEARRAMKWSQHILAEKSGIAQPTISDLENGKHVSNHCIDAILRALDLRLPLTFPREFEKSK